MQEEEGEDDDVIIVSWNQIPDVTQNKADTQATQNTELMDEVKAESTGQSTQPQVLQAVSLPQSEELPNQLSGDLPTWQDGQSQVPSSESRQNIFDQFETEPGNLTKTASNVSLKLGSSGRNRSDSGSDSNFTSVSQQGYKHNMTGNQVQNTTMQGLYLIPEGNSLTSGGLQLQQQFMPTASNQQMPFSLMSTPAIPVMYQPTVHQQVSLHMNYAFSVTIPFYIKCSVADPGFSIRGGSKFEIFSVRGGGGGGVAAAVHETNFQ